MTLHYEHHSNWSACPVDQLEWLVNGTLSAEEQAVVEAHLAECASCQADVRLWTELRHAMQSVSAQTPEPRADLFFQVEQQLDLLPVVTPWLCLYSLLQVCWFALIVCGEHFFAQARLIRRDLFWMPLFIVPLVSLMVFLPPGQRAPSTAALLVALLTALGMAFLYGQEVDPAREMTLTTLTSPHLVLGVRCCLVFGYDLLLNCGLALPLLAWQGVVTPAWFLMNWLAPLCCLSAIVLLLSILVNASVAVVACALLWMPRLFTSVQALLLNDRSTLPQAPWQQYENFWHQGSLLFMIAALAVLLAFIVLERKERFAR